VECTDAEYGGEGVSFDALLAQMQDSKYCLLLPGDSASTRALSEMMMAGCIPVLVGPPYATLPMHEDVDYTTLGFFFNVSDYRSWLTQVLALGGPYPPHAFPPGSSVWFYCNLSEPTLG